MSRNTSKIDISIHDPNINQILKKNDQNEQKTLPDLHYNRNEDQFIILPQEITYPSLPVHHDIENKTPPEGYISMLTKLVLTIQSLVPSLLRNMTWYFDPVIIHNPTFYQIIPAHSGFFLKQTILDLSFKPIESNIIVQGSNTHTHTFSSNRLYFETDYFPLKDYTLNSTELNLNQTIPATWKGESGQGYMIHGIWMDADINKFFSKLILKEGLRNYPYYPFTCKQHCISMNAYYFTNPHLLESLTNIILPNLESILDDLHNTAFSELMPLFKKLKQSIPHELMSPWDNLKITPYLNDFDQKEYSVAL